MKSSPARSSRADCSLEIEVAVTAVLGVSRLSTAIARRRCSLTASWRRRSGRNGLRERSTTPDSLRDPSPYCPGEVGPPALRGHRLRRVLRKPLTKFDRLLETYLAFAPQGFPPSGDPLPLGCARSSIWAGESARALHGFHKSRIVCLSHHESHAASAFFRARSRKRPPSPWTGWGSGHPPPLGRDAVTVSRSGSQITFPHSLGLLYSGFHVLLRLSGQAVVNTEA